MSERMTDQQLLTYRQYLQKQKAVMGDSVLMVADRLLAEVDLLHVEMELLRAELSTMTTRYIFAEANRNLGGQ